MCDALKLPRKEGSDSLWIVSRETSERLSIFEALLLKWNERINLVGPSEAAHLRCRHIGDSLQLLSLLPLDGHVVDLGSGGGFPGLVVAIAGNRAVTLVEADARKASFLREAARVTGAEAQVINERIERCGIRDATIVTARALAPLPRLLTLAAPLMSSTAVAFFPKGGNISTELTAARAGWQMSITRHPSLIEASGCILEVRHLLSINDASHI